MKAKDHPRTEGRASHTAARAHAKALYRNTDGHLEEPRHRLWCRQGSRAGRRPEEAQAGPPLT